MPSATKTYSKTCARAGAWVQSDGDDRVGPRGAGDLAPTRDAAGDDVLNSAWLIEGTGLVLWETRQTPLRARRVSTQAGRVAGLELARDEGGVGDPARGVRDADAGPAAGEVEARRPAVLAAVEVGRDRRPAPGWSAGRSCGSASARPRTPCGPATTPAASSAVPRAATTRRLMCGRRRPCRRPACPCAASSPCVAPWRARARSRPARRDRHARAAAAQVDGERGAGAPLSCDGACRRA